jgi:hypothetical protein
MHKDQEEVRIGPRITSQRRVGKALNLRIREKLHNLNPSIGPKKTTKSFTKEEDNKMLHTRRLEKCFKRTRKGSYFSHILTFLSN